MAQTPEQKASKYLVDALADSRFNEVAFANRFYDQPYDIQARFWNVLLAYVYNNAHNYELGIFPSDTYTIARLSKKIKDYVFSDEYHVIKHERYGDYEMENDLTLFD
jgi:hypothetical protein